jgi:thiol-disulfide isomerase/thioredoxin
MLTNTRLCLLSIVLLMTAGCIQDSPNTDTASKVEITGKWRAILESPGGPLPFGLEISKSEAGNGYQAVVINGEERAPFSDATFTNGRLRLGFDWYDSWIVAELEPQSNTLQGKWQKTGPRGKPSTLPFQATSGYNQRFEPTADSSVQEFPEPVNAAGRWQVTFTDDSGEESAEAIFAQSGNRITGTFLTEVGDYRYLEGNVIGNQLKLSTFDGAHAFLFTAELKDTQLLNGNFWSRDSYHATWTATRMDDEESKLGNEWELATITSDSGQFRFSFPDLDGNTVSSSDERFKNKPLLINIFGSWCPNCNDKAPILAEWHREYRDRGLKVIGLAFEFTGDTRRDTDVLRRFKRRHNVDYDILLAGTNDKTEASKRLPDLSRVIAYPQTIFVGRDGLVKHIHTGFSGPGTGKKHTELVAEMRHRIEELIR